MLLLKADQLTYLNVEKLLYLRLFYKEGNRKVPFCCPNQMSLTEELHQKLIDKFQEESFLDCFVVAIEQKGKQVSVYLDSDSAITFERCKMISRYLESWLDEKN